MLLTYWCNFYTCCFINISLHLLLFNTSNIKWNSLNFWDEALSLIFKKKLCCFLKWSQKLTTDLWKKPHSIVIKSNKNQIKTIKKQYHVPIGKVFLLNAKTKFLQKLVLISLKPKFDNLVKIMPDKWTRGGKRESIETWE